MDISEASDYARSRTACGMDNIWEFIRDGIDLGKTSVLFSTLQCKGSCTCRPITDLQLLELRRKKYTIVKEESNHFNVSGWAEQ